MNKTKFIAVSFANMSDSEVNLFLSSLDINVKPIYNINNDACYYPVVHDAKQPDNLIFEASSIEEIKSFASSNGWPLPETI